MTGKPFGDIQAGLQDKLVGLVEGASGNNVAALNDAALVALVELYKQRTAELEMKIQQLQLRLDEWQRWAADLTTRIRTVQEGKS